MERTKNFQGWLFSSPYLIYTLIFFIAPLVMPIALVFFDWNLISLNQIFVGLGNFKEALTSVRVHKAFINSYKFMGTFVPGVIIVSLIMALIVNALPRWKSIFAVGFFLAGAFVTFGI